jgi:hypothetical protein
MWAVSVVVLENAVAAQPGDVLDSIDTTTWQPGRSPAALPVPILSGGVAFRKRHHYGDKWCGA